VAAEDIRTAADLLNEQRRSRTPREALREHVSRRLAKLRKDGYDEEAAIQKLYPNTILESDTLRSLTTAILAGNHTLLFGPPGSGKTNLAKDLWNLFPKTVWVVDGCPVQDDPFSVVDPAFSKLVPPCPFCKDSYWTVAGEEGGGGGKGGLLGRKKKGKGKEKGKDDDGAGPSPGERTIKSVDPASVPVRQMRLREGYGFARVQGSPEVFPDNLTGTINIHKLEELGDPMSPLILEPGKLLQANRGLLIIDEIGKLPLGTQNVLLQALQESMVSPAKSRETFPAAFIAVATSNLDDLDNINEPLNDRLTNLHVGFNSDHARNRLIIEMALTRAGPGMFIPSVFIDTSAFLTETWRRQAGRIYEFAEVGSNRTMIDLVTRACAHALLAGADSLGLEAYRLGVRDGMMGRIRVRGGDSFAQNRTAVEKFLESHLDEELVRAGMLYWCTYFHDGLKSNPAAARKVLDQMRAFAAFADGAGGDAAKVSEEYKRMYASKHFESFARYVLDNERHRGTANDARTVHTLFSLLGELDVFECPKSGADL
jgi:nucleoside-triphosphatase THEP1